MSNNILLMQNVIIDFIKSQIPEDKNKAHIGTIRNGRVVIGNETFNFVPTVDLYFGDGDRVACLRPDNTNEAIVVGVL